MPRYYNSTALDIEVKQYRIPAYGYIQIDETLQSLPTGVSAIDEVPASLTISSAAITTDTMVTIPATLETYRVILYVVSGQHGIKFNSASSVEMLMGAGQEYKKELRSRTISDVRVRVASAGTIIVTVEKL